MIAQHSRLVRIRYPDKSTLAVIAPYGNSYGGWYVVMEFDPPIRLPRLERRTARIINWCIDTENTTGKWPTFKEIEKQFGISNRTVTYHFDAARHGIWRGNPKRESKNNAPKPARNRPEIERRPKI